ncbi:MAG: DUF2730 family protein [Pseudomonadota bacterium]
MDLAGLGKLALEVLLAVIAGVATVFGWVTKRLKEERVETDRRFNSIEDRLADIEKAGESRREEMEAIHRDVVEMRGQLKNMPDRKELAGLHAELKDVSGDVKGLASDVRALIKETARTTEYLMNRDAKS